MLVNIVSDIERASVGACVRAFVRRTGITLFRFAAKNTVPVQLVLKLIDHRSTLSFTFVAHNRGFLALFIRPEALMM